MIRKAGMFTSLILMLFIESCSLDFLNDSGEDENEAASYYEYDSENDIKYYYEGDGTLIWMEYYDFNADGQCIFIKHCLPSNSVLWSYVYGWSGNNLVMEAYFDSRNTLSWFNTNVYSGGNALQQNNYDENSRLKWFETWTYDGSSRALTSARYGETSSLEWAYRYEYDSAGNAALSSLYGTDSHRTAYIASSYDSSNRSIKNTGYGSTTSSDTFKSCFSAESFPAWGGVNTDSRNSAGLTAPAAPAAPSIPTLNLIDDSRDYSWMSLWVYDSFGYTMATLNSSYLPVYLKRSAPEQLNDLPIETVITYENSRVKSKTTTYNGETVLKLEFTYDSNSYLTSLNTTGDSLYIPLRYDFTYTSGVPAGISIYNEDTLLQRFVYEYSVTPAVSEEYARSIQTIHHYDGDNSYIGYYSFSYDEAGKKITIAVWDAKGTIDTSDDWENGSFILQYDDDGHTASLGSYDSSGNRVWTFEYSYDDLGNRIGENRYNADNLPEVATSLDVESLFEDLRRFLP